MVTLVALIIWRLNALLVLAAFLVFGSLDGLYLSSALAKVPDGAWFTLVLAVVLASIFTLWRYGKEQQWKAEGGNNISTARLILKKDGEPAHLTEAFGGGELTTVKGESMFHFRH